MARIIVFGCVWTQRWTCDGLSATAIEKIKEQKEPQKCGIKKKRKHNKIKR